ncbi:hypothetical protein WJE11_001914 [Klebsiella aerogenes]
MKERGMIFNSEMVRAILDGRKTQTRRIMKVQPKPCNHANWPDYSPDPQWKSYPGGWCCAVCANGTTIDHRHHAKGITCPYGTVGDRIWVRETFQGPLFDYEQMESYLEDSSKFENPEFCQYAADGKPAPEYYDADDNLRHGWRPSIHMPRWASRILLEITNIGIQRIHSISQNDAAREGLMRLPVTGRYCINQGDQYFGGASHDAREVFSWMWQSIYGEESWNANPWVWVIEFKRIEERAA